VSLRVTSGRLSCIQGWELFKPHLDNPIGGYHVAPPPAVAWSAAARTWTPSSIDPSPVPGHLHRIWPLCQPCSVLNCSMSILCDLPETKTRTPRNHHETGRTCRKRTPLLQSISPRGQHLSRQPVTKESVVALALFAFVKYKTIRCPAHPSGTTLKNMVFRKESSNHN
jgi:hypothetical protein